MKSRILAVISFIFAVGGLLAADIPTNAPGTNVVLITPALLTSLSEEMRTNHSSVNAQVYRAKSATASAQAIRIWEDPMAKVGGMGARTDQRADDGDLIYGVEQKLPLFGKPQAARRVAQAEAAMEQRKIDLQFQNLRRDLDKAVFRAAFGDRTVELGEQDIEWLSTLVASVESRYRNGTATLAETLQAQNERARRENQLRSDRTKVEHEHVTLSRMVKRDTHWTRFQLPEPASALPFNARLMGLAWNAEPKLKVMKEELRRNEAAVDAAKRQRLPDFGVGVQGRSYSRNGDFRSTEAMLTFNLPWGNRSKYRAEIEREKAMAIATEYDIDNEQKALLEEIHQLTIMIENARREALLYRDDIIPRSKAAAEAAHSGWHSGTGMLRDVIEARRMLTEAEVMYARAISEQYQGLSEVILCCGLGDLESLQHMLGIKEETQPRPQP